MKIFITILITFCLIGNKGLGQEQASFQSLVDELNASMAYYEGLTPFGWHYVHLNTLPLTEAERADA